PRLQTQTLERRSFVPRGIEELRYVVKGEQVSRERTELHRRFHIGRVPCVERAEPVAPVSGEREQRVGISRCFTRVKQIRPRTACVRQRAEHGQIGPQRKHVGNGAKRLLLEVACVPLDKRDWISWVVAMWATEEIAFWWAGAESVAPLCTSNSTELF